MDCCNYPDYRPAAAYGWGECYAAGYAPHAPAPAPAYPYAPSYAPYAPDYAHDHYARYAAAYRYHDYPVSHHAHYDRPEYGGGGGGGYPVKESRRRTGGRRDGERARARTPGAHHLQPTHTSTPPLDCGLPGRVSSYCDPHVAWSHYQMGGGGGGWGGGGWAARGATRGGLPHRTPLHHLANMHDHCAPRTLKGHAGALDMGGGGVFPCEDGYAGGRGPEPAAPEYIDYAAAPPAPSAPPTPPAAPAPVPLPAFQQAFGSTEIGKFAEAFSRAEAAAHDAPLDFLDWEPPDPAWPPAPPAPLACHNY